MVEISYQLDEFLGPIVDNNPQPALGDAPFIGTTGGVLSFSHVDSITFSVVPVPAAVRLFASGLMGLVGFARREVH